MARRSDYPDGYPRAQRDRRGRRLGI